MAGGTISFQKISNSLKFFETNVRCFTNCELVLIIDNIKSMVMNKNDIDIKQMTEKDWPEVARIYEGGIATKNATFQTEAPDWESWDKAHRIDCRFIALINDNIVGWIALSNVSSRCVYAGVAEVSVYVDSKFQGTGIGTKLMKTLIKESETNGIWTLQAGIFPENQSSIKLHLNHGFRTIGTREHLGKMDDIWRDVSILERRSKNVGIN